MSISSTDELAEFRVLPKPRLFPIWMSPIIGLFGVAVIFFGALLLGPSNMGGIQQAHQSRFMQSSRTIAVAMFQYSADHDGTYPTDNSSTEVFKRLLDGGYVNDPDIFFLPKNGKVRPVPGQKLKPENVGWDVTADLGPSDADELPVVFMTGFKVTYVPGGTAVRIMNVHPMFVLEPRTWRQWWRGEQPYSIGDGEPRGIPVTYKGNNAVFKASPLGAIPADSVPNFIAPTFVPPIPAKTYRQLTADGVVQ